MKKLEDPALLPTDAKGFYIDRRTHAVLNFNTEEKRIYDLQVSLEMMRNEMASFKKHMKTETDA